MQRLRAPAYPFLAISAPLLANEAGFGIGGLDFEIWFQEVDPEAFGRGAFAVEMSAAFLPVLEQIGLRGRAEDGLHGWVRYGNLVSLVLVNAGVDLTDEEQSVKELLATRSGPFYTMEQFQELLRAAYLDLKEGAARPSLEVDEEPTPAPEEAVAVKRMPTPTTVPFVTPTPLPNATSTPTPQPQATPRPAPTPTPTPRIASTATPSLSTDLSITINASPDPVGVGSVLTYTLEVTNKGPAFAQVVIIEDFITDGISFLSVDSLCELRQEQAFLLLICNIGGIRVGRKKTLNIGVVAPSSPGTIINVATVGSPQIVDLNPVDNQFTAETEVVVEPTSIPTPTPTPIPTPTPSPLVVHSSGKLDIPQTWALDLDRGILSGEPVADADILFRAATEGLRHFAPVSGAKAGYMGGNRPGYDGCVVAKYSTAEVLIKVPSPGFYVCVLTNEGRYSEPQVFTDADPGRVTLLYTTWAAVASTPTPTPTPTLVTINYPVGNGPVAVASDGSNIWVANEFDDSLTKLRASDGMELGTFPVGDGPRALAFDGRSVWVANANDDTVTRLSLEGNVMATVAVGDGPIGLAYDGRDIWVSNNVGRTVSVLDGGDGSVLQSLSIPSNPGPLVYDGEHVWVGHVKAGFVTKFRVSDRFVIERWRVPGDPRGLAFDGERIWVTDLIGNSVSKVNPNNGCILGTFAVGLAPEAVVSDGASIWIANSQSNDITRIRVTDGAHLATYRLGGGGRPLALAFDGQSIWVANFDGDTVTKIPWTPVP